MQVLHGNSRNETDGKDIETRAWSQGNDCDLPLSDDHCSDKRIIISPGQGY